MEIKYFPLSDIDNNRLVKIIRILFGVVCIVVAFFWIFFIFKSYEPDVTTWITIAFLLGFGFYQIWSGLGRATRFIEMGSANIRIKKNALLPSVEMSVSEIEKIDMYPLNVVFFLKSKKRILLRFGSTYHDINENVTDAILAFAETHNIPLEVINEEI